MIARRQQLWVWAMAFAVAAASAAADTIWLKNGDKVVGQVMRKATYLEVHTDQGVVKISDAMVDKIEWDAGDDRGRGVGRGRMGQPAARRRRSVPVAGPGSWRQQYAAAMSRKVDLDFSNTPAMDAIDFLRDVSGVNILVSPEAREVATETQISLKVNRMDLKTALEWVLKLARLHATIKGQAIYITDKPDQTYQLRRYNVRDLLTSIRDKEPTEMNISAGGGGGGGGLGSLGGDTDEDEEYDKVDRATDLMKLVLTMVEPTSWGYAVLLGAGADEEVDFGDFF